MLGAYPLLQSRLLSSQIRNLKVLSHPSISYPTPLLASCATKSKTTATKKKPGRNVETTTKTSKRRTTSLTKVEAEIQASLLDESDLKSKQNGSDIVLRDYQEECVEACLAALREGTSRIGVSSPTGSGKTTMFTSLVELLPPLPNLPYSSTSTLSPAPGNRVLIIVPSIELALQAARTVSLSHPNLSVEIEQGSKYVASGVADVTVATYQTLHRSEDRLNKFDPRGFKAIIVDEAHHAAAPSYISVLSHFDPSINVSMEERKEQEASIRKSRRKEKEKTSHASSTSSDVRARKIPIIGFSATFSRHDGLALGRVFDRIVWHRDLLDMIEEKWLCPVRFTSIKADLDLSSVKVGAFGDFATASLASVVNTPAVNRLIVRSWLDRAWSESTSSDLDATNATSSTPTSTSPRRRSTLVFCVNIDHVEQLTHEFRMAGIDARYLHGGTATLERRELLEDFREGLFPVLVNCAILTEGADVPSIDCVLLARPTRSRNIFSQMIGRGLRLSPKTGKKECLILDVVGSIEKGVVCVPTLFGLDVNEDIEGEDIGSLRQRGLDLNPSILEEDPGLNSGPSSSELADPTNVTYIDYDNPWELHKAMVRGNTGIVERMSRNAWVDCGGDVYVLDIPTAGFIRVERNEEEPEEKEEKDEENDWISRFTPKNSDQEEIAAKSWPFTRRGASPFRRARHVLYASNVEAAIRGSDTYATSRVLRGGPMSNLLSRYAPWRMKPASEKQRSFVEKRLGLIGSRPSTSIDAQIEVSSSGEQESKSKAKSRRKGSDGIVGSALPNLTKGQASTVLTRLQHGAKARWEKEAKFQNRRLLKEEKETKRKEKEMVKVGDLNG